METIGTSIQGYYRDVLLGPKNDLIHDSGWTSNTIVDRCHILLASFMRNKPSQGIQNLYVGRGKKDWDTLETPPAPPASAENLVDAFSTPILVKDLELAFLDENDEVTNGYTSRLQITATLAPGYPTPLPEKDYYPLREFGLFGDVSETDYMINNVRHTLIRKYTSDTLIRVIRLYF